MYKIQLLLLSIYYYYPVIIIISFLFYSTLLGGIWNKNFKIKTKNNSQ